MNRVFVGEGGSAKVYRIWREDAQEFAAEKRSLHPLVWEAIWLKKLQGFAVPQFYEIRQEGSGWVLSMEYLYGQTFEQILCENSLEKTEYLEIMNNILHEFMKIKNRYPDIIFCDLKPSNIIVNKKKQIFFIDFDSVSKIGVKKICKGTRPYAAPEMIEGCPGPKSDIYSVAQMLWQVCGWERSLFFFWAIAPCIKKEVKDRQGSMEWLLKAVNIYQIIIKIENFLRKIFKNTFLLMIIFVILSIAVWLLEQNHDIIKFTRAVRDCFI